MPNAAGIKHLSTDGRYAMTTLRVLLVWPSSLNEVLGWGALGAVAEPLALEYLAATVGEMGHDARILDLRLHPDELEQVVRDYQPNLLGVTAYSMHVRRAVAICDQVKAMLPSCKTVVGGHHATFLPEDFFKDSIDWIVSGEGCGALGELLASMAADLPVAPQPGLWTRGADGAFRPPLVALASSGNQLDDMPRPDRTLVPEDRSRYFIDWMRPVALMRTTLGCPYRCTFCSIWKVMEGRYLSRDIDAVVDELATIKEEWVFLVDDEAFINRGRMVELAAAIKQAGLRKRFFTYCRIDTLLRNREAVEAWRGIGLERLFIGIDAIDSLQLDEFNKKCRVDQIEQGLALANELDIEVFAQFVVNTSYTPQDFARLRRFVEHHRVRYPSFTILTPLPGTDLLKDFTAVDELQSDGRPNWDLFDCQNAVVPTKMSKPDFKRAYRNLYHVFKGAYASYREHNYLLVDGAAGADPARRAAAHME
jgi:radical SAM superfamily enzyme YgiQ (UPF0313 family)